MSFAAPNEKAVLIMQWAECRSCLVRLDNVVTLTHDAKIISVIGKHQFETDFETIGLSREAFTRCAKGVWRSMLKERMAHIEGFIGKRWGDTREEIEIHARQLSPEYFPVDEHERSEAERAIYGDGAE